MNYRGALISRERLRRNWSQEGLCRGICTVSYLSKIETGKAEPSEEILRMLLDRLELDTDPAREAEASHLAEEGFELLFSYELEALQKHLKEHDLSALGAAESGLELELLRAFARGEEPPDPALESCMDKRSLALQRILQHREEEAVRLCPNAFTHLIRGIAAYEKGAYSQAIDALRTACELAAGEGAARILLESRLFLGNSYCNRQDLDNMERHYRIARRLARAMGDERATLAIGYNTASAWIETGRYEEAYAWFAAQEDPSVLSLHKLAICCEKTGRRGEGLAALDRTESLTAEEVEPELAREMCRLVRFRLEHPDYLEREEYGERLIRCFNRCRSELSTGYAVFHLPWVLEWYRATRQYKKACELLEEFPAKTW